MRLSLFIILSFCFLQASAQTRMSRQEYIDRFAEVAISEMELYGIPASITLAQGMLESNNGNSKLAREGNNHFGIKCHSSWEGEKIYKDDDRKNECFRVYESPWRSFRDHSKFLVNGSRYDFLFEYRTSDYKSWAKGLKKAGYATNPKYPDLLIKIIEDNQLYNYDKGVKQKPRLEEEKEQQEDDQEEESVVQQILSSRTKEVVVRVKKSDNGIKYIDMPHSASVKDLADQLEMAPWQIRKYNDAERGDQFLKGDRVYLQPKKRRASVASYTAKEGDTPRKISQKYGYKLNKLIKENGLTEGQNIEPGTEIKMNTYRIPLFKL